MAFSFRGPQSPQDSAAFPGYSNNPLSPPRTSNRRSVGGMSGLLSTASTSTTNETRAGLTRRFTTNALPALSPIGQQRRMAAGDTMQVSAYIEWLKGESIRLCKKASRCCKEKRILETIQNIMATLFWRTILRMGSRDAGFAQESICTKIGHDTSTRRSSARLLSPTATRCRLKNQCQLYT